MGPYGYWYIYICRYCTNCIKQRKEEPHWCDDISVRWSVLWTTPTSLHGCQSVEAICWVVCICILPGCLILVVIVRTSHFLDSPSLNELLWCHSSLVQKLILSRLLHRIHAQVPSILNLHEVSSHANASFYLHSLVLWRTIILNDGVSAHIVVVWLEGSTLLDWQVQMIRLVLLVVSPLHQVYQVLSILPNWTNIMQKSAALPIDNDSVWWRVANIVVLIHYIHLDIGN